MRVRKNKTFLYYFIRMAITVYNCSSVIMFVIILYFYNNNKIKNT